MRKKKIKKTLLPSIPPISDVESKKAKQLADYPPIHFYFFRNSTISCLPRLWKYNETSITHTETLHHMRDPSRNPVLAIAFSTKRFCRSREAISGRTGDMYIQSRAHTKPDRHIAQQIHVETKQDSFRFTDREECLHTARLQYIAQQHDSTTTNKATRTN